MYFSNRLYRKCELTELSEGGRKGRICRKQTWDEYGVNAGLGSSNSSIQKIDSNFCSPSFNINWNGWRSVPSPLWVSPSLGAEVSL